MADSLELQRALESSGTKEEFQRVLCIWLKGEFSFTSAQIARAIGWKSASVRRIQSRYCKEGAQCFLSKQRGGRRRENIPFQRECAILDKFIRRLRRGGALNISQLRSAYELSVGNAVSLSTIYRLIDRHGMRRYLSRVHGF
jgi:transposase